MDGKREWPGMVGHSRATSKVRGPVALLLRAQSLQPLPLQLAPWHFRGMRSTIQVCTSCMHLYRTLVCACPTPAIGPHEPVCISANKGYT
mgnify:CR=1 FL=1